ncbi:MAG TPA: efflux RND transporter periplasmic adaptor subunit [Blastocatellia bacterium]|nr:efflux RND transporter periplasmic adaptor subunit [Blastocatellia bacterium]
MLKHKFVIGGALLAIVIALLIAVGGSKSKEKSPAAAPPPANVEVVQVERQDVPIYSEWIGSLDGMVNAEIRAQVTGYLLRQNYKEGSFVRKGQLLFEIDPRPLQAALDQAKGDLAKAQAQLAQSNSQLLQAQAQLAQAEANQVRAQLDVDRYTPLAKEKAITTQEYDNSVQSNIAAKAQVKAANAGVEMGKSAIVAANAAVEAARATVKTAELNLSFTKITSPIDGVAGIAQAQVGNLIQPNNPNSSSLTTVSTLDPIKVYFTLGEQEYLAYTRRNSIQSKWGVGSKGLELELVLSDGTAYAPKGKFFVADRQVDQKTGSIRLAGIFPNPGNTLRPGQYARVRAITSRKESALLVPQRAVTELQGSYRVAVVGNDNKVSVRPVKVGPRVGAMWVIEDGLKPDERIVAEGTQKVRPDAVVNPIPFK